MHTLYLVPLVSAAYSRRACPHNYRRRLASCQRHAAVDQNRANKSRASPRRGRRDSAWFCNGNLGNATRDHHGLPDEVEHHGDRT